jgi:hypothetical protein
MGNRGDDVTITSPTTNEFGDEVHPSFGVVRLSRVTSSPGIRLFDSAISHSQFVRMEIARASRSRGLHHDFVHGSGAPLIEVDMSLSQWGALVSSFNQGSGTPVTLHRVAGEVMPEAAHESRLAQTAREVADAAADATAGVAESAQAIVTAFNAKAGRREMSDLINNLRRTIGNLPRNMQYAADTLTRHSEDVVAKARADIEAAAQFPGAPAITAPPATQKEVEA